MNMYLLHPLARFLVALIFMMSGAVAFALDNVFAAHT